MSASIYFQPVNGTYLPVGAASSFWTKLGKALGYDVFMTSTLDIDATAFPILHAFKAGLDSKDEQEAMDRLIAAVMEYGQLRVWVSF